MLNENDLAARIKKVKRYQSVQKVFQLANN